MAMGWDSYFVEIDGKIASMFLDLDASSSDRETFLARIEVALHFTHARLHALRGRLHGRLEVRGRGLHLALQLAQLVELDLAVDVGLDVVDVALQSPEQVTERARRLGEPLGPDHDERHHGDDDDFRKANVKHL